MLERKSDYKMPKAIKRIISLANFRTTQDRSDYKNALIVADIHEKSVTKARATRNTEEKGD